MVKTKEEKVKRLKEKFDVVEIADTGGISLLNTYSGERKFYAHVDVAYRAYFGN